VQDQERELLQRGYETLQTLESERIADLLKAGEVAHDHLRAIALLQGVQCGVCWIAVCMWLKTALKATPTLPPSFKYCVRAP
jgi:hypothetical protein